MNSNFSALIEGIVVKGAFKKSNIACPDYDGNLVITVENVDEFDVHDVEKTLALDNIVTFGKDQNEFVINYVKASDCEAIFEKVCDTIEFSYCCM